MSGRSFAVSIDVIKDGLLANIDSLVPSLFPNARRVAGEWVMGDLQGGPGRAVSINRRTGWMKDFRFAAGQGGGGDILTVVAAGACDGDVRAAIPWAIRYLNLGHLTEGERRERERRAEESRRDAAAARVKDGDAKRRAARGHWISAEPIAGTPADRYLLGRGIDIRALRKPPGSLRFKPMLCPETQVMRPCMLAIVNSALTGEQLAVHRTFLHVHPDGRVTKADADPAAPMQQPKRAYGEYGGGFIPLQRGASERPIGRAPAGEWLALSEGIEDGLSVALACPEKRVGAALSLSNMGGIALPEPIGGVFLAAQHDEKAAARGQLDAACRRLAERGVAHHAVYPPDGLKDWNDWLRALAAPAAEERVA